MDDARPMRTVESISDLDAELQGLLGWKWSFFKPVGRQIQRETVRGPARLRSTRTGCRFWNQLVKPWKTP